MDLILIFKQSFIHIILVLTGDDHGSRIFILQFHGAEEKIRRKTENGSVELGLDPGQNTACKIELGAES